MTYFHDLFLNAFSAENVRFDVNFAETRGKWVNDCKLCETEGSLCRVNAPSK